MEPVQVALHFASSLHSMLHVPEGHVTLHVERSSHRTLQSPEVQRKLHVSPFEHVQSESPHSLASPASAFVPPDVDVPPSFVGVPLVLPLEPPLLVAPPELDDGPGAPPPIVQSYEHAAAMTPPRATTDRTEKRCTLRVYDEQKANASSATIAEKAFVATGGRRRRTGRKSVCTAGVPRVALSGSGERGSLLRAGRRPTRRTGQ